jgi:hypothetical protein
MIKIRFIERCTNEGKVKDYLIQERRWDGWKYIAPNDDDSTPFCKPTKEELLKLVLELHYKKDIKQISILEFPALRSYHNW